MVGRMMGLRRLADSRRPNSLADRMRTRRFELFERLLAEVPEPRRIIDVGGTPEFWVARGYGGRTGTTIFLVNLERFEVRHHNLASVVGDAVDLRAFGEHEFDIAFSNSVIEHLETRDRQFAAAAEIRRVSQRHWVQTPNYWFPIEPHFLTPGYQFMPLAVRRELLLRTGLGHYRQAKSRDEADSVVRQIRLMSGRELREAFPGSRLWRERFLGLTKSWVVLGGWMSAAEILRADPPDQRS
jgi:hypothetical protein